MLRHDELVSSVDNTNNDKKEDAHRVPLPKDAGLITIAPTQVPNLISIIYLGDEGYYFGFYDYQSKCFIQQFLLCSTNKEIYEAISLPDGRFVLSVGHTSHVINPSDVKPCLQQVDLVVNEAFSRVKPKVLDNEVLVCSEEEGLKIFQINNLNEPHVTQPLPNSTCVHAFTKTIYAFCFENGNVKFYERNDKELKALGIEFPLGKQEGYSRYRFTCHGPYLIKQQSNYFLSPPDIYQFKIEEGKIKLDFLCSVNLDYCHFAGGYLLNTRFARLIMERGGQLFSLNPTTGEYKQIFSARDLFHKVILMKDHIGLHSGHFFEIAEIIKFESKELKEELTGLIKSGISFFPAGVARLCADYVGMDIEDQAYETAKSALSLG